ncbi:MAG: hypothetical protein JO256_09580 [Alphaproteobacteria bacterium]|nr:hypothetical protein [Alphaproteobacteria bacterium]
MEIHKPRPVHSWREFLKEYAIIVLGVLTALVGEELVVMVHHHFQVADLRSALRRELAWNLLSIKDAVDDAPCIEQRLKEVEAWETSLQAPVQQKLKVQIPTLHYVIFRTSTWRSAAGGTLDNLPLDERVAYAQFYDGVENNSGIRNRAGDAWADIRYFQDAHTLSDEEVRRISRDIREVRGAYRALTSNYQNFIAVYAPATGVRTEDAPPRLPNGLANKAAREEVCKAMIQQ